MELESSELGVSMLRWLLVLSWSSRLNSVSCYKWLVKAEAKTYFYSDLKSPFIKSWCTKQFFDFQSSLFQIFILIHYLICRSCSSRYSSIILSRSSQLGSYIFVKCCTRNELFDLLSQLLTNYLIICDCSMKRKLWLIPVILCIL